MNIDAAMSMLKEAGDCLDEAQRAYSRSSYNLAVRRSQETVELALKGILRLIGIESAISSRLAKDREPSFYMERIYSEITAKEAVDGAQFVYEYIEKLLRSVKDIK